MFNMFSIYLVGVCLSYVIAVITVYSNTQTKQPIKPLKFYLLFPLLSWIALIVQIAISIIITAADVGSGR